MKKQAANMAMRVAVGCKHELDGRESTMACQQLSIRVLKLARESFRFKLINPAALLAVASKHPKYEGEGRGNQAPPSDPTHSEATCSEGENARPNAYAPPEKDWPKTAGIEVQ